MFWNIVFKFGNIAFKFSLLHFDLDLRVPRFKFRKETWVLLNVLVPLRGGWTNSGAWLIHFLSHSSYGWTLAFCKRLGVYGSSGWVVLAFLWELSTLWVTTWFANVCSMCWTNAIAFSLSTTNAVFVQHAREYTSCRILTARWAVVVLVLRPCGIPLLFTLAYDSCLAGFRCWVEHLWFHLVKESIWESAMAIFSFNENAKIRWEQKYKR